LAFRPPPPRPSLSGSPIPILTSASRSGTDTLRPVLPSQKSSDDRPCRGRQDDGPADTGARERSPARSAQRRCVSARVPDTNPLDRARRAARVHRHALHARLAPNRHARPHHHHHHHHHHRHPVGIRGERAGALGGGRGDARGVEGAVRDRRRAGGRRGGGARGRARRALRRGEARRGHRQGPRCGARGRVPQVPGAGGALRRAPEEGEEGAGEAV
ncbi:hypothetical protein BD413DRAFT_625575, partial [Trametes elegans]